MVTIKIRPEPVALLDDEGGRRYIVGEGLERRERPSQSEICRRIGFTGDYSKVPLDILTRAQAIGTCVHKMIEMYLTGIDFEMDGLDPRAVAQYTSAVKLIERENWRVHHVERAVVDFDDVFACTPDLVYVNGDAWGIVDWKTSVKLMAYNAVQLHLQKRCYIAEDESGWRVPPQLFLAHLQRDGSTARLVNVDTNEYAEYAKMACDAEVARRRVQSAVL